MCKKQQDVQKRCAKNNKMYKKKKNSVHPQQILKHGQPY